MVGNLFQIKLCKKILKFTALYSILLEKILDANPNLKKDLADVKPILNDLLNGAIKVDQLSTKEELNKLKQALHDKKSELEQSSRTSSLWIEYQRILGTVRKLITGDRLGSISLHIEGIAEALPIFAATGHTNYNKAAYLHLQNILTLEQKHPEIHPIFQEGHHVVGRTDRQWSGIPADLLIEQALMRTLKSTGGLTRGSNMSESQRSIWLLSMPVCSEYNMALQELTKVKFENSEQH